MRRIDAHQHFWQFDALRDSWINDEMMAVQKDFLPADLQPLLQQNNIDGCVVIQSNQSEKENTFQLANAEKYDFIKGIVGWADLQAENIAARLHYYQGFKKMKGFRHILQGEPQRNYMLSEAFMHGISLLKKYNFTYDILVYTDQLKYTYQLVKAFPSQLFVIDHLAKPCIKDKEMEEWKRQMDKIGTCKNVFCKISGMVTEANWKTWKKEDFTPYLDAVTKAFGTDRLIFGSDWPVCLVAASYTETLKIVEDYFARFTAHEKEAIFGGNATSFYRLND